MVAEGRAHGVGDFADGRAGAGSLDGGRQQIAVAVAGKFGNRRQRFFDVLRIATTLGFLDPADLGRAHGGVVDLQNVDRFFVVEAVLVDADDHFLALVDGRLAAGGSLFDQPLRQTGIDRLGHAAHRLDFLDQRPGFFRQLIG
ncbi:hypothetical protein D3C87_1731690 [compost metagenome]